MDSGLLRQKIVDGSAQHPVVLHVVVYVYLVCLFLRGLACDFVGLLLVFWLDLFLLVVDWLLFAALCSSSDLHLLSGPQPHLVHYELYLSSHALLFFFFLLL